MDKKILKNLIYNTSYQILTLILPFITIPYVSRIFSPEQLGIYSSTFAEVSMFCIIGMFAMNSYGTRCVAKVRDNKIELSRKFKELRRMQLITVTIALLLYFVLFIIINKNYRLIYLIQGINILAYLVDISWLYMGIEDFKKTVTRNTIVKVISVIVIVLLVKNSNHLIRYILILSSGMFLGNMVMWIYKKDIIIDVKIDNRKIKEHIKEAFFLLIPLICFQIYTSFDRSVLSSVSTLDEVGMFDQSQKIIRMAIGIVTSLGIVMLPRIANMVEQKEKELVEIMKLLKKSMNLTLFIVCGVSFGLIGIAENFVPWFYGSEYTEVIKLINITSAVCILTAMGSFFSNQYAIPADKKKAYSIPIIIAGISSIILNLLLGSTLGAIGAGITIVVVESIALILRIYFLRKDLDIKFLLGDLYKFLIAGLVMYMSILFLRKSIKLEPNAITTIVEVVFGGIVYMISNMILNQKLVKKQLEVFKKRYDKNINKKNINKKI